MNSENRARPLLWADVARAVCVCLVVLMHGEAQIAIAGWSDYPELVGRWHAINTFVRPIRLPTFFTISGILAANAILLPKAQSFRKGFVKPIYLYVIWATVFAVLIPNYPAGDAADLTFYERVLEIFLLGSPAWYLYALGLFYLVASVTRKLALGPLLFVCFAISMVGAVLLPDEQLYASKFSHCLFFFVAGVRLKEPLIAFAESASLQRSIVLLAVYVAGSAVAGHIDMHLLPLDIVAVAFSLTAFSLLGGQLGSLSAAFHWMGRRTLMVYVLHFPLICLLSGMLTSWGDARLLGTFWLGLAWPLIATILVVPLSLAIGALLRRIGLGMLFDLPRRDRSSGQGQFEHDRQAHDGAAPA